MLIQALLMFCLFFGLKTNNFYSSKISWLCAHFRYFFCDLKITVCCNNLSPFKLSMNNWVLGLNLPSSPCCVTPSLGPLCRLVHLPPFLCVLCNSIAGSPLPPRALVKQNKNKRLRCYHSIHWHLRCYYHSMHWRLRCYYHSMHWRLRCYYHSMHIYELAALLPMHYNYITLPMFSKNLLPTSPLDSLWESPSQQQQLWRH